MSAAGSERWWWWIYSGFRSWGDYYGSAYPIQPGDLIYGYVPPQEMRWVGSAAAASRWLDHSVTLGRRFMMLRRMDAPLKRRAIIELADFNECADNMIHEGPFIPCMHARPDHSGPPAIIFRDDSIRFYGTTLIIIICLSSPKYGRSDNWPEQFIERPEGEVRRCPGQSQISWSGNWKRNLHQVR